VRVDRQGVPGHGIGSRSKVLRPMRTVVPDALLPVSTRAPDALCTSAPLNFGSSASVKCRVTRSGAELTVLPTAGLALSSRAWASADVAFSTADRR
jgi:hypothetical protein